MPGVIGGVGGAGSALVYKVAISGNEGESGAHRDLPIFRYTLLTPFPFDLRTLVPSVQVR